MMVVNEILGVIIAAIIAWLNFIIVDTYFGLPETPGVKGAEIVGRSIKKRGGDLSGGFFQGNILCSPDASAGTLIASIGVMILGFQGGLFAAFLVYIGNRLCADPGYAGTIGALTTTFILILVSYIGVSPEMFVAGMIIAITSIQGLNHPMSSQFLGKIAKKMQRSTKL
jgi:energy-converting hydrogenase A subunit B